MGFYSNIINWMRGMNNSNSTPTRQYVFGSIVHGYYKNWKHDPNPTILCLGTYMKSNGKLYTHGIQLHAIDTYTQDWLLNLILRMKKTGTVITPMNFYKYLKMNNYNVVKYGYRIYHAELCAFNTISPGFSNITMKTCSQAADFRDNKIKLLNNSLENNSQQTPKNTQSINQDELKRNITNVMNTKKLW